MTLGPMNIEPVTLEGDVVRLEPLRNMHFEALCEVGLEPELWQWTPFRVWTPEDMRGYISSALEGQAAGSMLPFVTIERASGRVVGSTRFMSIDLPNRRLEIGSTWIARDWRRTAVNTEAKYLMLLHAFETLGAIRVELKTDALNERSRTAILRIGAKQEGIFRSHMLTWSGRRRDSVYFAIIDAEWPEVKRDLETKLGRA